MASSTEAAGVQRGRLFFGICLALVPTGASFALVSNILGQLKQDFILTNYQVGLIGGAAVWGMAISLIVLGPLLEGFGMKNGTRLAFLGHLSGITLMIAAVTQRGDPSAFWLLMLGAATLAVGNGMIEVAGNPLVAALYPDDKTKRLNWFHAFFPIGLVAGGLVGFALATFGGGLGYWPWQLAVIYVPILVYGYMVLPQSFPQTENTQAGLPVGEMFRYTLTSPLFLVILVMMGVAVSLELGSLRWVPAVLTAGGVPGILVLVWVSAWMVVLRLLSKHFITRLAPTGMLLMAGVLILVGLWMLSSAEGLWPALFAATIFAWGVAFNFPTFLGLVSERMPKTGSLGIVLTAGVGLGAAGGIGVPLMGKIADVQLADALPAAETVALLERVEPTLQPYIDQAQGTDPAQLGYRVLDIEDALAASGAALDTYRQTNEIAGDQTANALRAIGATQLEGEPLVDDANALLAPAELYGGQQSFRYVAPSAIVLTIVFGAMYLSDRRRGGYKIERLERREKEPAGGA